MPMATPSTKPHASIKPPTAPTTQNSSLTSTSTAIPSKVAISSNSTNQPSIPKTSSTPLKAPIPQTSYKTPTPSNSSLLLPPIQTNALNSPTPMAPPTHQPTNQTVVAAEADASGNINLLSWNQATNSFNLQLFGANGTLTGSLSP